MPAAATTGVDAAAVRSWCRLALEALGRAREETDAINVYPVPDGDTGTNLYLTAESAAEAVEALFDARAASGPQPSPAEAVRAMARGALLGARGNSGTILAQLLRGMTEVLAAVPAAAPVDGALLAAALERAAASAYEAVAHPVEGTVLTVAAAAARAAAAVAAEPPAQVVRAAHAAARTALARTPEQLGALARAGVVDAGGRGLVVVLGALVEAVTGESPMGPLADGCPGERAARPAACASAASAASAGTAGDPPPAPGGPAFEVTYLLDAEDGAVPALRARLDALGDSLVVVGGEGLWNVHVHVDDAGAAVEAGVECGRPHRIRITHFGAAAAAVPGRPGEGTGRGVVAVVRGEGVARLCEEAGATVVADTPDAPASSGDIAAAIRRARAAEVVLLPNDEALRSAAGAAAEQARADGVRVAVVPTRSTVQGIAALAVHDPSRRFDEDVVAMTAAAGATRHAELAVAEHRSWTMAGVCQAGDVLGLIDGDVAVIGRDLVGTGTVVLDRMLAAGGEMVTLVVGEDAPADLADRLEAHVREEHLAVDTVVYRGGRRGCPLLIGVE
ncbi:DAK2 domain-containing protein [Streptomyces thermolineatus]|uniref:DAK2 domain-containing protein n=1 Tax=Streptomyces thermolineatus TaxID=44033 RepID=A0ABP5Z912_9ACTN